MLASERKKMNIQQINSDLAITDFLDSQGFQPVYRRGTDWWYVSPLRPAERTASFKVSTRLNRWYDHGAGEGGKLFDLALRLGGSGDVRETIQLLSEGSSFSQAIPVPEKERHHLPQLNSTQAAPDRKPNPPRGISILEASPLCKGSELSAYLQGRGIRHATARAYCQEVRFSIGEKAYQAIGFANRSGGYELRNAWFKGSSSPKDITFVDRGARSVCLLEGFLDFLSLLELRPHLPPTSNFIILNSVALADRSVALLGQHRQVYLFLDRDEAGRRLTERLLRSDMKAIDASSFYQEHKDVNEYLTAKRQRPRRHRIKPGH